jgi:hypothetical protein
MNGWIPDKAIISEERYAILELIKLCKKQMAYRNAVIEVLQGLGQESRSAGVASCIVDAIRVREASVRDDVDVQFRHIESALLQGKNYADDLQDLVSKYL